MNVLTFQDTCIERFLKTFHFLEISKYFGKELVQGSSYQFCLASFSDSGILCFLSYNRNKLVAETFCHDHIMTFCSANHKTVHI